MLLYNCTNIRTVVTRTSKPTIDLSRAVTIWFSSSQWSLAKNCTVWRIAWCRRPDSLRGLVTSFSGFKHCESLRALQKKSVTTRPSWKLLLKKSYNRDCMSRFLASQIAVSPNESRRFTVENAFFIAASATKSSFVCITKP